MNPRNAPPRRQLTWFRSVGSCLSCLVIACGISALTGQAAAQETQIRFGTEVPRDVEVIYERGLGWLANQQTKAGNWDGGDSGSGITGMCVMAFLASGEDPNFGKYSENIRRAVRSMIHSQDGSTGYFPSSMYHHGFAMLGLAEVYGALDEDSLWANDPDTTNRRSIGEALELGVRCAVTSQKNNQWGAWRYSPDSNDADTSVSGAVLMGLPATRNAGVKVPDEAIDKALEYFRSMTTNRGEVGYSGVGGGGSYNLRAIATLVYAIGKRKDLTEYQGVLEQMRLAIEHEEPNYPEYFRYYAAQALFQGDFEAWNKWNQKTIRQFKETQGSDGSFPSQHGPAYGTAMSMLALALNYRFLPIYER